MMTEECKRQLANLAQLAEYWKSVEPETVDFQYFADGSSGCGTLYCIGGHIAHAKMFGVRAIDGSGAPYLSRPTGGLYGGEVSEELFGCQYLFVRRGNHPIDQDYPDLSDYQIAFERFNYAKDNLCRKCEDLYDGSTPSIDK